MPFVHQRYTLLIRTAPMGLVDSYGGGGGGGAVIVEGPDQDGGCALADSGLRSLSSSLPNLRQCTGTWLLRNDSGCKWRSPLWRSRWNNRESRRQQRRLRPHNHFAVGRVELNLVPTVANLFEGGAHPIDVEERRTIRLHRRIEKDKAVLTKTEVFSSCDH
jgi:hypothetical protein